MLRRPGWRRPLRAWNGGGACPYKARLVFFQPIRGRFHTPCCQVRFGSSGPLRARLRRSVCSPSAEPPDFSGGFHTSWDGGSSAAGGADGRQTAPDSSSLLASLGGWWLLSIWNPRLAAERGDEEFTSVFACENESVARRET